MRKEKRRIRSKKDLEIALQSLKGFEKPKIKLEQYSTDPRVAADMLWVAYMNKDLQGGQWGRVIGDFGCGTGILGLGCLLLDAEVVYFDGF